MSLLLASGAGAAIPLGAHLASIERIRPGWLEDELRHSVIAFGGGVLLAAVSLVMVPRGIAVLPVGPATLAFVAGGLAFFLLDKLIASAGRSGSQFLAMLLDFIPEAMAMGAALATGEAVGLLLALLIALQNLPEGFNAFREVVADRPGRHARTLALFWLTALCGPLFALAGFLYLADNPATIAAIMLAAAAGIIYLTFQDIAPQVAQANRRAPAMGAVLGFLVGLIGHMLLV